MLASAVAQAAASEVPHVAKTFGETKTRQHGKLLMKDPSSMLTELEEMVQSGETPAFDIISMIKNTIVDDIMPGIQTTRGAAANDTLDFLDAIELCNDDSKARGDQIEGSIQVSVDTARSHHAVCRDAQKALYHHNLTSAESYCVKLGIFLHEAEPLSIEDGTTRADAVDYVKSASMNANMCDRSEVCELDDNCTQKEEELRIKEVECLQKQKDFEGAFCTWKTQLELNCQELDRCHSTTVAAYQHHVNKTEILLEKWNVETAALQKILCYCNVWLSDMDDCDNRSQHNATQFDVCKDKFYTPNPVDHGTPAEKVSCPLTSVECHPGKSCFHQEYSGFADFVAPVVPCMQITTTTAAVPTQACTAFTSAIGCPTGRCMWNNDACVELPLLTLLSGSCTIDEDDCMMSPQHPGDYGSNQRCKLTVSGYTTVRINAVSFDTESNYDHLILNGHSNGSHHSGSDGPTTGTMVGGDIYWGSDGSANRAGWKICFETCTAFAAEASCPTGCVWSNDACKAPVTCASFSSCSGDKPVNRGGGMLCTGDESTCDENTCCAEPNLLQFLAWGWCSSSSECGLCQGDCDSDADCGAGLYCFQRGLDLSPVPQCTGGDSGDVTGVDYCTETLYK